MARIKKRSLSLQEPPDLGTPFRNKWARDLSCDALAASNQSRSQAKSYIDAVASVGGSATLCGHIPDADILNNAKLWVDKWGFTKP
jgi:hypothetical protein